MSHLNRLFLQICKNIYILLLSIPILFILFGYIFYPTIQVVLQSFTRDGSFSYDNYIEFFSLDSTANLEALANSILISIGSVILSAIVGVPLAFIFTRYRFPGRALCSNLAVLPFVLPPLVGVISFMFLYGETGILPRGIQALFNLQEPPFEVDGVPAIFFGSYLYNVCIFLHVCFFSA